MHKMEEMELWVKTIKPKRRVKRKKVDSSVQQSSDGDACDWISKLPDCLLVNILSRLDIEQAIETSLLSKRWRYLWRSTSCLEFTYLRCEKDSGYTKLIDRTPFIDYVLSHHEKTKVHQLSIFIKYVGKHAIKVDSWIRFSSDCNVEEFKLELNNGNYPETGRKYTLYKMHHSLFECGSLTKLKLCHCDLNLPASLHLRSLKTLSLQHIYLSSDAIECLTSSSPILEDLFLRDCNRSDNLNITIKNEHVKNLSVEDYQDSEDFILNIYAPKLLFLTFGNDMRRKYNITNLQSVKRVDLSEVGWEDDYRVPFVGRHISYNVALVEVLHSLCHVRELKLSSSCIRVLSFWKFQGLDPFSIQATNIELEAGFTKWELPGIAYLLQIASSLENLSIYIPEHPESEMRDEFVEDHDFNEKKYWKSQEPSFSSSVLTKIKTIDIGGYNRRHSMFYCGYPDEKPDFSKCLQNEAEFVKFLLKNAKTLERMVIRTSKHGKDTDKVIEQVARKLSRFPKASSAAELLVT